MFLSGEVLELVLLKCMKVLCQRDGTDHYIPIRVLLESECCQCMVMGVLMT